MFNKLGIQLFTVRDYMNEADQIRQTFKRLKSLGYDQGQTAGCAVSFEEFGKIAKEENFEIVGTHERFELIKDETEKAMKVHDLLGTKNMGIGGMPGEFYESAEAVGRFNAIANEIGRKIGPKGYKFTYHNHSGEFKKFGNETMMDLLVKGTDPETVSFVLDTFWVQYGGGDVRHYIEKLAGRIDILHLKDMKEDAKMTEIGNGNLLWDKILELAFDTGVKYLVVEQDGNWKDGDPFKSAEISANYLRKLLGI